MFGPVEKSIVQSLVYFCTINNRARWQVWTLFPEREVHLWLQQPGDDDIEESNDLQDGEDMILSQHVPTRHFHPMLQQYCRVGYFKNE